MIELERFSELAKSGNALLLRDNEQGLPTLQSAPVSFKGMLLSALSYVPFLKDLKEVAEFRRQAQIDNAQTLGVFLFALSQKFGSTLAEHALRRHHIDLSGNTPLDGRTVRQMIGDAERSMIFRQQPASAATPAMCGFTNLGNTCYANSALKLLISSIGGKALLDHLENFHHRTTDPDLRDAAQKFMLVIEEACINKSPLNLALKALFDSLQKLPPFAPSKGSSEATFKIVGVQHDANLFLGSIWDLFSLSDIPGHAMKLREAFINGLERQIPFRPEQFCHIANVADPEVSLEDIVHSMHQTEYRDMRWAPADTNNTRVVSVKNWEVNDIEHLHRFHMQICALTHDNGRLGKLQLAQVNLTDDVTIVITDQKTQQNWEVTLEPREVIVHRGSLARGHYYMYAKQGGNEWFKHDDRTVRACEGVPRGEQPAMISFAVKEKKIWSLEPDNMSANLARQPALHSGATRSQ